MSLRSIFSQQKVAQVFFKKLILSEYSFFKSQYFLSKRLRKYFSPTAAQRVFQPSSDSSLKPLLFSLFLQLHCNSHCTVYFFLSYNRTAFHCILYSIFPCAPTVFFVVLYVFSFGVYVLSLSGVQYQRSTTIARVLYLYLCFIFFCIWTRVCILALCIGEHWQGYSYLYLCLYFHLYLNACLYFSAVHWWALARVFRAGL